MTIIIMAIFGVVAGFVLDELIARLAREPYERGDEAERRAAAEAPRPGASSRTGAARPAPRDAAAAHDGRAATGASSSSPRRRGIFALLGRQYQGEDWHLAIVAFYASVLIICTATDILAYRVPNAVTYPAIVGAFAHRHDRAGREPARRRCSAG